MMSSFLVILSPTKFYHLITIAWKHDLCLQEKIQELLVHASDIE